MFLINYLSKKRLNRILPLLKETKPKIHLDIGCGKEKFLLNNSPAKKKIGFDSLLGTEIIKKIPLENNSVDFISMLAVLEHLDYPIDVLKECQRILKKNGILYITVPNYLCEPIIEFLFKDSYEHKFLFGKKQLFYLARNTKKLELKSYKKFEFGLNQEIIFIKK